MADSPYSTQTISNYNNSPPPDDGTTTSANQLSWAKHKTKLSDPVKTLSESINTELVSAFAKVINTDADQNNAMAGSLAFTKNEKTISSGLITPTRSFHTVDTEGDTATDVLDTIATGSVSDGCRMLLLGEDAARVVTLTHTAGTSTATTNIVLAGGADKTLSNESPVEFVLNGSKWYETQPLSQSDAFDKIDFTVATAPAYAVGRLAYDDDAKSHIAYNDEAEITLNIGRENWIRCRNTTGSTITNGKVVYISGATGNLPLITLADSSAKATSRVIGVATHDIENNSNGYVTTFGVVNEIDTSAFTDGDILYLATTAGGLATVAPAQPNLDIIVGTVALSNASTGKLLVHPDQEIVERASQVEVNTGTDDVKTVTPNTLNGFITGKTDTVITASDEIAFADADDSNNTKKDTVQGILDLVPSSGEGVIISSTVAANDANITFTGLDSTYDTYEIQISDLVPTTDNVEFYMQVGDASGIDVGSSDYGWATYGDKIENAAATAVTVVGLQDNQDTQMILCSTSVDGIGNAAGEGIGGTVRLHRPGDGTTFPTFTWEFVSMRDTNAGSHKGGGYRRTVITLDRLLFKFSSGNISTGRITLIGKKHA